MARPSFTHITVECQGCPGDVLNSGVGMMNTIRAAADVCGLHVVQEGLHRFRPQGITGYLLLRESHISVHTWPEKRFALVDVLSCSVLDIEALVGCLKERLKPRAVNVTSDMRRRSTPRDVERATTPLGRTSGK